jgi:hypothetical protein
MLSPNVRVVLEQVLVIGKRKDPLFLAVVLDFASKFIQSSGRDHAFFDLSCVYLFICSSARELVRKDDILNTLLAQPFFDSNLTVFDDYSKKNVVEFIRTRVLEVVLAGSARYLDQALMKLAPYPLLFTEMIHRIVAHRGFVKIDHDSVATYSRALMSTTMYYHPSHYLVEQKSDVELARSSIFFLITELLRNSQVEALFFENQMFVSFFSSLVFELRLRQYVLTHIRGFLLRIKEKDGVTDALVTMFLQLAHLAAHQFPDERYLMLMQDIIETLNEVFLHVGFAAQSFQPICLPLFSSFLKLSGGSISQSYILSCIQFFTLTGPTIPPPQMAGFESAIQRSFPDQIPETLLNKLLQFIAGEVRASRAAPFWIRHPEALKLLLNISRSDPSFLDLVQFVDRLCLFSASNCYSCHDSEFDLLS